MHCQSYMPDPFPKQDDDSTQFTTSTKRIEKTLLPFLATENCWFSRRRKREQRNFNITQRRNFVGLFKKPIPSFSKCNLPYSLILYFLDFHPLPSHFSPTSNFIYRDFSVSFSMDASSLAQEWLLNMSRNGKVRHLYYCN